MRFQKLYLCLAMVLFVAFAMTACPEKPKKDGKDGGDGSVAKTTADVEKGGTAEVKPADGSTTAKGATVENGSTAPVAPARPAPVSGSTAPVSSTPPIASDVYWKVHIERLKLTRDLYAAMLKVYEEEGGATDGAREKISKLQIAHKDKMQAIFDEHGLTGRDFYPRGPDQAKRDVFAERQNYLKEHPDLKAEFDQINKEMRDLRNEVKKYRGDERMHRRGMRGEGPGERRPRGPGAPVPMPPEMKKGSTATP